MRGLKVLSGLLLLMADLSAAEDQLWQPVNEQRTVATAEGWLVSVDAHRLIRGATVADSTFFLDLPDGKRYRGVIQQTRREGPHRFLSTGRLGEHPTGEFLFLVDQGRVGGTFGPTSEQRYCLLPTDQPGVQRLIFQPESALPRGSGVRPPGQRTDNGPQRGNSPVAAMTASPPQIDVLILYTQRVSTLSGGLPGVQFAADLAIQQANQAYADSAVVPKLRLAHVAAVDYVESGVLQTDLDRLTRPADGLIDEAITLRLDYRADLVHLFLAFGDQSELGWLNNYSTFNTTWSFSVSNIAYLANDTFTRAVGSNQGLDHDWIPMSLGAYPQYSFGYAFTGGSGQLWKTLMSNGPGTRIRRHSNPTLQFDGRPTGQPLTAANPAFAAQSLNNTGNTIAGIMDSTIVPPPVISSPVTATGVVNQFFQYQITATNGPTAFGAAGLPMGLLIDTGTGLITGTPKLAGTYTIDLSATNAGGTGVKVLTLTVDAATDCPAQRVARRLEAWGLAPPKWLGQTEPKLLDICRHFRDDVLKSTPEGRELIERYYRHRPAVLARFERDPQLLRDVAAELIAVAPQLERTVAGRPLSISASQRQQIDHCLARLAQEADAEFVADVAKVRDWLDRYTRLPSSP